MDSDSKPKCPRCGTHDVKLVSSQQIYALANDNQRNPPVVTISTHKCSCGMGFTDAVNCEVDKGK